MTKLYLHSVTYLYIMMLGKPLLRNKSSRVQGAKEQQDCSLPKSRTRFKNLSDFLFSLNVTVFRPAGRRHYAGRLFVAARRPESKSGAVHEAGKVT